MMTRGEKWGACIYLFLVVPLVVAGGIAVFVALWNEVMPGVGLPALSFWQVVKAVLLCLTPLGVLVALSLLYDVVMDWADWMWPGY